MLKSDRLVCEKNATKAQPVTNCNLGSINYIYFNYKVNLLIGHEKILQQNTPSLKVLLQRPFNKIKKF